MRNSVSKVRRPSRKVGLLPQGRSCLKEGVEYYFSASCGKQGRFSSTRERQDDGTDDFTGSHLILRPGEPGSSLERPCFSTLVWHQAANLLLSFGADSERVRWRLEQRFESSFFPDKCSCFRKQHGQTFCRGAFVTLQLRVNFLATVSVFPPKFIPVPLTCCWTEPCCNTFSTIHHHPSPTCPHINPCSANDRSRLHHVLWHGERATEYFPGVFWLSVT